MILFLLLILINVLRKVDVETCSIVATLYLFVMRMQVPIQDSKSNPQPKTPAHAQKPYYQSNGPPSNLSSTGPNDALSPLNLTPSLTLV